MRNPEEPCYGMVLAGVLMCRGWWLFAGIAGFVLGVRLSVLGFRLAQGRGRRHALSHNYIRDIGLLTVALMGAVAATGFGYLVAIYHLTSSPDILRWLLLIELAVSLMIAGFMLYVMREETTPTKSAALLGLADR